MQPKTIKVDPSQIGYQEIKLFSPAEEAALRRHIDEIKDDPDFIALWEAIAASRKAEE
jgi:hypothetical protein